MNSIRNFLSHGSRCFHSTPAIFAGHSKWANIRHIKAAKDGAKSTLFTRLSRQIRIAIQDGGSSDPQLNTQLKNVIDIALKNNMPINTINTTIKKSQQSKTNLKKYTFELRSKKAFLVCVIYTDNLVQTKMDIATIVRKGSATFVDAAHLFEDFGLIEAIVNSTAIGTKLEDLVTEDAITCGAEDVEIVDASQGIVNFTCRSIEISAISIALTAKGYSITNAEHIYVAKNTVMLSAAELKAHETFLKKLREVAGVEDVYANVEL